MSDWNSTLAYPQTCYKGEYAGWMDVIYCLNPYIWAFVGLALALGLSIVGAAW